MHVRFHCYARAHGKEWAMGAIDSRAVPMAARLFFSRVMCPMGELERLLENAIRTPLVKHRIGDTTVWAVPTVG